MFGCEFTPGEGRVGFGESNFQDYRSSGAQDSLSIPFSLLNVSMVINNLKVLQMKEIQDKILRFEELDLQMEKEWQQLDQMKNLLFADQLSVLSKRSVTTKIDERGSTLKAEERGDENAKTD